MMLNKNLQMKKAAIINLVLAISLILGGCAANMAANGQNGPDLNIVEQEKNRKDVERYFGAPEDTVLLENGNYLATYDVEANTEPSLIRAAGHGILDIFTFGLWEVIGGPAELYLGRRVTVTAEYDDHDRLVKLSRAND